MKCVIRKQSAIINQRMQLNYLTGERSVATLVAKKKGEKHQRDMFPSAYFVEFNTGKKQLKQMRRKKKLRKLKS